MHVTTGLFRDMQCHGRCCVDTGSCPSSSCASNGLGGSDSGALCVFDGVTTTSGRVGDPETGLPYYAFCNYAEYG